MKLKKILAQSLAVAMVLSSVPVANFTALAAEDPAAYASDDAGIVAATETDVLPAPYGYKNLQLTVGPDVKITTSANTEITESSGNVLAANGANNGASPLQFDNSGDKWINFHFEEAKKVSGLLYKNRYQTNGPVKIARADVKKQGSDDYITVYQTESASAWTNPNSGAVHEALFNTVSDVTDVKFYAVATHYNGEGNRDTVKADAMRILTIEDNSAATATALTSDENSGTATVSIPGSTVSGTTMSVSKGVTVKYQAKAAEGRRFLGWRNASGDVLSYDTTYTTTVSDDITLTAVFENYYEKIDQSVLKANAKDNSHAQGSRQADGTYNDGAAANAFDGNENTLWHENYDNTGAGSQTRPSASNPIWVQTSFGTEENGNNKVETVGCLTYRGRPDGYNSGKGLWSTRISDYVILAANVASGSPTAGEWAVVKAGTMPSDISDGNAVSELEFTPVNATHIRLVCLSTYGNDNFVCAGEINLYKVKDTSAEVSELKDITIQGVENGSVTIVPSGYETTNDANETAASGESASIIGKEVSSGLYVKLIAVPKEGYQFAGWKNIEKDKIVSRESTYLIKDTEVTNYEPVFSESNYSEIKVLPDNWTNKQSNPSNIRANSQMLPPNNNGNGNDGPAWYAFDKNGDSPNTTTLWHGKYGGNYVTSGDNMNIEGNLGDTAGSKSIWVEVSFSNAEKIKRITVTPRSENNNVARPKDYKIWVANTNTTPSNENFDDFVEVASGTFANNTDVKTIDLPVAVQPSHIRIAIYSRHYINNNYMAIANISLYENTADKGNGAKVVAIPVPEVNDNTMGTVSLSKDKYVEGLDTEVTLTATPNTGYHFVKWIVNDNSGNMVSELNNATETVTMNSMSGISYQALFAKDAEVNISLDQTYLTMYVDDTQKLEATVKNATDTSVVTWTTTDSDVATVDNGTVTAKKAGETTITATTSVGNDEKSATCTVVVNEKPSKDGLLALVDEAKTKYNSDTEYSENSRKTLEDLCDTIMSKIGTSMTTEEIQQAEEQLRTAMENLVAIYKVSVPNDNKIELTSDKAEHEGKDNDYKWIYTPLFAKVSLNVTGLDLNNEEFAGWIYNGKTVCTSTSYKFYVVGEMQLRYEMGTKVKEEVNLFCSSEYSTTLGKLSFIGKRAVPSRYKVVEHGIVITDAIGWAKYENNQKAFVKGASRTKKSIASGKSNYGTFEAKLKCGRDEEWYGRYYVTYTDGTTTYTLYSDVENYPHDDFK